MRFFLYIFYFLSISFATLVSEYSKQNSAYSYNKTQANISVWLSAASYCDINLYPSMTIGGPATDFILTDTLYAKNTDILGFVGVLHSSNTIYVVFRGSSSLMNWIDDFEIRQVPYKTFLPECSMCKVHHGFYRTALSVKTSTINAIMRLKKLYPKYKIICTGHSLGAAVTQLISMELRNVGIYSSVYNFGQPRVGEINYSKFVNKKIKEFWRFTHNRDIVVHIPPRKELDYYHSCVEVFQDEKGKIATCSNTNCEDIKCADKYKLYQTNEKDHDIYLDHEMKCITE
jgi:predicted lipase